MKVKRVAILGAGNGGITAAADLKLRGFDVSLYDLPQFSKNIDLLRDRNGEVILKEKDSQNKVKIDLLTTEIKKALEGAQVILMTITSPLVEDFTRIAVPYITEEQVVMLHTAACMGSVRFVKAAREMGFKTDYKVGEFSTLAYGTRAFPELGEVQLYLRVKEFFFASYPAKKTKNLIEVVQQIYESAKPIDNVWGTLLSNGNPEVHPGIGLLNAGRIEFSKGEFYQYVEGITEHTINILLQIGEERLSLGRALGYELDDGTTARIKRGYLEPGNGPLHKRYNTSPVFSKVKGPTNLQSRYFTEDISNGLVLYSSLGKAIGVQTPAANAIITLSGFLLKRDFVSEGLTLEKLGLSGLNRDGLIAAVS